MASPTPRPAVLKLVEGRAPGRDSGGRQVKDSPTFKRIPPEPPEWMPDEAKAEWQRVVEELSRLEILKPIDRAALAAYCLTWDRLVSAQRELNLNNSVLGKNSQGVCRHPAVAVIEAASKELRSWAAEFGLTPSAESRLSTTGAGNDDGDDNPFAR